MGKPDRERWAATLQGLGLRGRLPESLTERVIEAARTHPTGERYKLADGEVPGLALQVAHDGGASFLLHYRTTSGRQRTLKIAGAGEMPIKEVRAAAQKKLAIVRGGGDPAADAREAREAAAQAKSSTVRAYLVDVYSPRALVFLKDGGHPQDGEKPSGVHARILAAWAPLLDEQLGALTRDAIEKVLADRKEKKKAMGTLLRDWSAFRAMLVDACDRRLFKGGPPYLAAMPIPTGRRPEPIRKGKGNQRVRWIGQFDTDEQLADGKDERKRFADALDAFASTEPTGGDFLRFAARLALSTGMRRGEIVRLRDSMINVRQRSIHLPRDVTKSATARVVYLNDAALQALKGWTVRGTRGELCPGESERWEDRITKREWPALCAAGSLSDLHFHDLRHDFAVRLLRSGATLQQVRDALGHASSAVTERYAHVLPSDVRNAVLAMV